MSMYRACLSVVFVLWLSAPSALWAGSEQAGSTTGGAGRPQTRAGLEMLVRGLERAPDAALNDCPPGTNTVKALTKPGEEFVIVAVSFKVTSGYKPTPLKRPVLRDAAGNSYNTGASFLLDVSGTPEFSCAFPFRVPKGTSVKSVEINGATFDLGGVATTKP